MISASTYVRVISKNKFFCDIALPRYNTAVFFVHIALFLEAHVSSDCGVGGISHKSHHPVVPSFFPYTHGESWAISLTFTTATVTVNKA